MSTGSFCCVTPSHDSRVHRPCSCVVVHCSVIYWMSGLSADAGDFFYFLAITLSVDTALAAFFRFCVFLSPSLVLAEVLIIEQYEHTMLSTSVVLRLPSNPLTLKRCAGAAQSLARALFNPVTKVRTHHHSRSRTGPYGPYRTRMRLARSSHPFAAWLVSSSLAS
jgi:hypothetical protein